MNPLSFSQIPSKSTHRRHVINNNSKQPQKKTWIFGKRKANGAKPSNQPLLLPKRFKTLPSHSKFYFPIGFPYLTKLQVPSEVFSSELRNTINGHDGGVIEVINHKNSESSRKKLQHRVATDVPRTSCHQYLPHGPRRRDRSFHSSKQDQNRNLEREREKERWKRELEREKNSVLCSVLLCGEWQRAMIYIVAVMVVTRCTETMISEDSFQKKTYGFLLLHLYPPQLYNGQYRYVITNNYCIFIYNQLTFFIFTLHFSKSIKLFFIIKNTFL